MTIFTKRENVIKHLDVDIDIRQYAISYSNMQITRAFNEVAKELGGKS